MLSFNDEDEMKSVLEIETSYPIPRIEAFLVGRFSDWEFPVVRIVVENQN